MRKEYQDFSLVADRSDANLLEVTLSESEQVHAGDIVPLEPVCVLR